MKKLFLVCALAGMCVTLTACDAKTETDDTATEVSTVENTTVEPSDTTEQVETTTEQVLQEEPEKPLYVSTDIEHYYDDTVNSWEYFNGNYGVVEVIGEDYPELKAQVDTIFANIKDNYIKEATRFIEDAKTDKADRGDDFQQYSIFQEVQATRTDGRILSLQLSESSYSGGAHGNSYIYGITLDAKTGQEISFEALGDIKVQVKTQIMEYLNSDADIKEMLFEDCEATIDTMLEGTLSWYLTGQGFVAVLNAYDVAPYAAGTFYISIPYEELTGFNEQYLPTDKAFYLTIPEYQSVSVDIGLDGVSNQISYSKGEFIDDYYYEKDYLLIDGEKQVFDSSYFYDGRAYYLQASDGSQYVLVTHTSDNDYQTTTLYDISSGTPMALATKEIGVYGLANDAVWAGMRVHVLGTFYCYDVYSVSQDGFTRQSERMVFDNGPDAQYRRGPILKQALTVMLMKDGVLTEQELPAGTRIYPINSDGDTVVGFELEDGTYGEISFERVDYSIQINGINDYELFDELPYAG